MSAGWVGAEDLAGDERTIEEVRKVFGRAIGRAVEYRPAPWGAYREAAGEEYPDMFRSLEDVGYDANVSVLREEVPGPSRPTCEGMGGAGRGVEAERG